ncbi:MAG: hypothetical protein ACKVW3_15845 [Phycisphaerales bacterium]
MRSIDTVVVLALVLCPAAGASVIPSVSTGGVVTSASVTTPNPGNNNVLGLSTNQLIAFENWTSNATTGLGFAVASGPSTEYTVRKTITNNTGTAWIGFECYIGAGNITTPTPTTSFVFDLDLAPMNTFGGTSTVTVSNTLLTFTGFTLNSGQTMALEFNMDLPTNSQGGWAIQQRPIVMPSPGAAAVCFAGLGMLARRRRA